MRRYQDKLLIQAVICLAIFALVRVSAMIGGDTVTKIKDSIREQAQKNYSIEEIKEAGDQLTSKIVNAPSALVSVITQADEAGEFGAPVNEDDKDDIKTVHAAGSGKSETQRRDKQRSHGRRYIYFGGAGHIFRMASYQTILYDRPSYRDGRGSGRYFRNRSKYNRDK